VPEGVVDQLEAVEVDEEHGQVGAPLHGHQELALELVVEQRAVAQAGQRVVVGQPVQLGLGRLAVGDVGERAHHHGRLDLAGPGQAARAQRQPLAPPLPSVTPMTTSSSDSPVVRVTAWGNIVGGQGMPLASMAMDVTR
jgi:predicted nicotinamide N-methyase